METITRVITAFSEVDLQAFGDLEIAYGDEPALRIEAPREVLDRLITEVQNGRLLLKMRPFGWPGGHGPVRYLATTPLPVERVTLSGSGSVRLPATQADGFQVQISGSGDVHAQTIKAGKAHLSVSGSGNIVLDGLQAAQIEVAISGSGKVEIQDGAAETQAVRIPGSGRYVAPAVRSDEVVIQIAGSGQADVWAVTKLSVRIAGSGAVRYRGQPAMEQHVSGIGKIASLGE